MAVNRFHHFLSSRLAIKNGILIIFQRKSGKITISIKHFIMCHFTAFYSKRVIAFKNMFFTILLGVKFSELIVYGTSR